LVGRLALVALTVLAAACGGGAAPTPAGTPAVTLSLIAQNSKFDQSQLTVTANAPFAIQFENRDSVPHNVSIQGGPPGTAGEVFGGPAERTYVFAALPAGSYTFACAVHPEMHGTIESR
jgi:plastocyanin